MSTVTADRNTVQVQLQRLDSLSRDELAAEWVLAYAVPAPRKSSREFLLKAVAHHVQMRAGRDVRPAVRRTLLQLGRQLRDAGAEGSGARGAGGAASRASSLALPPPPPSLKPGSRLIRAWHGDTHEVTVCGDRTFEWRGRRFRSLSQIASSITGTRRNGPAFFGLREAS